MSDHDFTLNSTLFILVTCQDLCGPAAISLYCVPGHGIIHSFISLILYQFIDNETSHKAVMFTNTGADPGFCVGGGETQKVGFFNVCSPCRGGFWADFSVFPGGRRGSFCPPSGPPLQNVGWIGIFKFGVHYIGPLKCYHCCIFLIVFLFNGQFNCTEKHSSL